MLPNFEVNQFFKNLILGGSGVFKPTGTSRAMLKAAIENIQVNDKILDLGCGSGILGIELLHRFNKKIELFMSDISFEAVDASISNLSNCNFYGEVKQGSLFNPWENHKFDVVVSDVSGVAPEIGKFFGWFDTVPNNSGKDGTELATKVLREAGRFMNNRKSKIIFPLISLSDESIILETAKHHFKDVVVFSEDRFPLGRANDEKFEFLRKFEFIRTEDVSGTLVFFTTIVVAANPRESDYHE